MVEMFDHDMQKMGRRLQDYRVAMKVTQKDVAKACGRSKNHISAIERGINSPSLQTLVGYCETLNRTPNELLGIEDKGIIPDLADALKKLDSKHQEHILDIVNSIISFSE